MAPVEGLRAAALGKILARDEPGVWRSAAQTREDFETRPKVLTKCESPRWRGGCMCALPSAMMSREDKAGQFFGDYWG